jgi:hypothetical protein
MKILKFLPGSIALVLGAAILTSPPAVADPYCYSFGLFATCVETPVYTTPIPPPPKPLPVWVCKTVYSVQFISSVVPGPILTLVSRVILVPSLSCLWNWEQDEWLRKNTAYYFLSFKRIPAQFLEKSQDWIRKIWEPMAPLEIEYLWQLNVLHRKEPLSVKDWGSFHMGLVRSSQAIHKVEVQSLPRNLPRPASVRNSGPCKWSAQVPLI